MPTKPPVTPLINDEARRFFYIENLRILLTILVILLHSCIAYGGLVYGVINNSWYYIQPTKQLGAFALMNIFIAVTQAFVLGSFFFLAAYFTKPSYDRKGPAKFFIDRLIRLGVPLQFYGFILSPVLIYLGIHIGYGSHAAYNHTLIDYGVLWFVAALLIFTSVYTVWRTIGAPYSLNSLVAPTAGIIVLFAIIIGVISFFVRIAFPVSSALNVIEFRLGHFSQYIACFILGLLAYKNDWLNTIQPRTAKKLAILALLSLLFFPVFFIISVKVKMSPDWFTGGFHWQSLLYAIWEQVIGFSLITAMLYYGKKLANRSTKLLKNLSRYTYAVYIFHPLVLVSLSLIVRNWGVEPSLKILVVAPLSVIGSFLLAAGILRIPAANKII